MNRTDNPIGLLTSKTYHDGKSTAYAYGKKARTVKGRLIEW